MKTLVDLFCGKGGWSKPALAAGWRCIGYDIVNHGYPGQLIQKPCPISIAEIKSHNPTAVIASPPCEEYARFHLPWIKQANRPDETLLRWAVSLQDDLECPVVIECSHFAARHVEGARYAGSYALWGDVPILLPTIPRQKMKTSGTNAARRAMIEPILAEWIIGILNA